jgi:predicted GH43/DUF377 family glycosyl hydrolase
MNKFPKIFWKRSFDHPYIPPVKNSVAPEAVTTPDVLVSDGKIACYIGGVEAGRERIMRLSLSGADLDKPANDRLLSASVVLNAGPFEYDRYHVYDPATVIVNNQTYLFYSAIGTGLDSIGLAISEPGQEFMKMDHPVLAGRSPEVVYQNGQWFLYFVLKSQETGYRIYGSVAKDGLTFQSLSSEPLVTTGPAGSFDQYEVTTPRIFSRGRTFYMIYGASQSSERKDMPQDFGLARSGDLIHWEKYPYNPIFQIGSPGAWDDGAIWFGTVFEWNDHLYLLYEGGRLVDIVDKTPALTQVGLAGLACADFDRALLEW